MYKRQWYTWEPETMSCEYHLFDNSNTTARIMTDALVLRARTVLKVF